MIDLKSMQQEEIISALREMGEPAFRGKQVFSWLHKGAVSFDEMMNLSKSLREKHPAKRTFQAIRIEVNGELESLKQGLESFFKLLNPGGRMCIITFHSLEDRIVKEYFKSLVNVCTCPPEFPVCVCGKKPMAKIITRKPILPSPEELEQNPRSKSAKLRIIEKL